MKGRRRQPAGSPRVSWDCGAEAREGTRTPFHTTCAHPCGVRRTALLHQQCPSNSVPFLSPPEPPSLMFLNGNCLESLKKEEPEGGRRRLSHPGNMGWMRPSQEMTPLNRSHHSGFGLFCGVPGPEIESFSLQVSRRRWCWRSTRCSGTMNTHVATSLLTACWTTSQSCAA
uniref:Uncharacterized protein n=1 Tax=Pongo abelii TaxID=9601 RepID=A0A8I5YM19_PONAB